MPLLKESQSPDSTLPLSISSGKEAALFHALRKNRGYYLAKLLKIQTKSGDLSNFAPNEQQQFIIDLIWCLNELETPVRLVICKARQIGMSTLGAGLLFHATTMWPHRHAKVIAHDTDTTELLFEKSKMFYNQLPEEFKPKTERSDRKQIVYGSPLHSRLTISTAGTKTAGSGSTVQYLHCSEVAKWENPGQVMTSLMQAVPKASVNPNTVIIIESTANGQGGYYHEQYKEAKEGKEQLMKDLWEVRDDKEKMLSILQEFPRNIGWLPIFFPWYEFKEYTERIVDKDWFRGSLTPEELELQNKYNLTLEQLQFRRTEIENLKKDERGIPPEELFKQEYPSNDTEAFLVTGTTFFHQPSLLAQKTDRPVLFRGNLSDEMKGEIGGKFRDLTYDEWKQQNLDDDGRVKLKATEDIYGSLSIWERPEKGGQYVVSGDVSLGERENSDFSVLQVLKKMTDGKTRQVARWRGKVHPEVFAKYGIQVSAYYNEAILGFENNSFGVNCIRVLQNSLYPYPYIRNSRNFKEISEAPTEEWGWNTNVGTKNPVLAEANRRLYEGLLELNDPITVEEMQVFKQDGPVKLGAPPGMHDDCVMSLAIGLWIVSEHPYSPHTIEGAIPLADRRAMEESARMQPEDTWDAEPEYETSFA